MGIGTADCITKRRVRALMIALALVFVWLFTAQARAESDGMIRVKLTRLGAPKSITLTADCDYCLASDPSVVLKAGETATVTAEGEALTLELDGARTALGETAFLMRTQAGNRGIKFIQPELSNRFCGDLGLAASGGVITAVLNIYIENYLYGVVGYAMSPSAGLEALKAQAVAARTYALRRKSTRGSADYDLADSSELVFKGLSSSADYADVLKAVNDTRGGVLYYDGALAQCVCCASNGGQTESSRNAGGPALSYTVVKDDPFDYDSKTAVVRTARINKDLSGVNEALYAALTEGVRDQLEAKGLSDAVDGFKLAGIESVTACESRFAAPSRLYKSLTFKLNVTGTARGGGEKTGTISVSIPTYGAFETWYDLSINPEDNETVWVVECERTFEISFRRSGSGVGLSQRGAQVMAQRGKRVAEILAFYYPGTEGKRLTLTDTTRDDPGAARQDRQSAIATARLTDRTDLRGAADAESAPTATVAAGAVVEIYGVSGEWASVGSSGKYGYIPIDSMSAFSLAGVGVERASETTYARATSEADVRRLPAEAAPALGTLAAGEVVQARAWNDTWLMVEWQGQTGFVSRGAAALVTPEPSSAPETVPDDPEAFVEVSGELDAMLRQDAPLFESANELSSTLETLKQGDRVRVLAYSRDWARVRTQSGRVGCVRQESITADTDAAVDGGIEGGEIHRVKGKRYMNVVAGIGCIYASWSTDSEVLRTVYYGERVRVGAYNTAWVCVRVNNITGFMRAEALSADKLPPVEGGAIHRLGEGFSAVVLQDVSGYAFMSADAERTLTLSEGQRVAVEAYNGAWAVVRVDGVPGFVRIQYLERTE